MNDFGNTYSEQIKIKLNNGSYYYMVFKPKQANYLKLAGAESIIFSNLDDIDLWIESQLIEGGFFKEETLTEPKTKSLTNEQQIKILDSLF